MIFAVRLNTTPTDSHSSSSRRGRVNSADGLTSDFLLMCFLGSGLPPGLYVH